MSLNSWNDRYKAGDTPWENGMHHPEIERLCLEYVPKGKPVLEIGCGLGTNAEWLSRSGYQVTAIDIAADAIDKAIQKSQNNHLEIQYQTLDFLKDGYKLPSYSAIVDCAVFHTMSEPDVRTDFAKKVAHVCQGQGYWINLSCSVDHAEIITQNSGVKSPPCLSAKDIMDAVEPFFEIVEMKRTYFSVNRVVQGNATFHAWGSVFRKR